MKLLVVVPTIHRAEKCKEFLTSLNETKQLETEVFLGVDQEDLQFQQYINLSKKFDFHLGVFSGDSPTKIMNTVIEEKNFEDVEYFMPCNDDFIFKTPGWDKQLIEEIEKHGKGIAYGNDLLQGENLPTTSIISGSIVRKIGWLQLPTLQCLYGDNVWQVIGQGAGCLFYRGDVIIEHQHPAAGFEVDKTAETTNSEENYKKDREEFVKWLTTTAHTDIAKVREL